RPTGAKTTNGGMPNSSNGGVPETGNGVESCNVDTSRVTSETGNTPCPKQATPLSETGNGGVPETGNERLSFLRQSKEDNPMKASQHLSQAQDAASAPFTDLSVGQKTEELPPRASPKPIETREQLIERLQK